MLFLETAPQSRALEGACLLSRTAAIKPSGCGNSRRMPAGIGHTTFWAIEEEELTLSLLSTCLWHKRGAMGTGRIPEIPFSSPRFKSRGLGGRGGKRVKQSSGFHPGGPRGPRSSQRSQGRGAGGLRTPLCSVPKCPIEWDSSFQHSSYAISSLRARKVTGPGVRKTSLCSVPQSRFILRSLFSSSIKGGKRPGLR